jgi:hypothetical protein
VLARREALSKRGKSASTSSRSAAATMAAIADQSDAFMARPAPPRSDKGGAAACDDDVGERRLLRVVLVVCVLNLLLGAALVGGMVTASRDVDALAARIEELYRNPEKRREMGKAACANAQNYSWDHYRVRLKGFLDGMLATR